MNKNKAKYLTYGITAMLNLLAFALFCVIRQDKTVTSIRGLDWLRMDYVLTFLLLATVEISSLISLQYFFSRKEKRLYKTVFSAALLVQALILHISAWLYIIGAICGEFCADGYVLLPFLQRSLLAYICVNCVDFVLRKATRNRLSEILQRNKVWDLLYTVMLIACGVPVCVYEFRTSYLRFFVFFFEAFT